VEIGFYRVRSINEGKWQVEDERRKLRMRLSGESEQNLLYAGLGVNKGILDVFVRGQFIEAPQESALMSLAILADQSGFVRIGGWRNGMVAMERVWQYAPGLYKSQGFGPSPYIYERLRLGEGSLEFRLIKDGEKLWVKARNPQGGTPFSYTFHYERVNAFLGTTSIRHGRDAGVSQAGEPAG
jgi:hypothetical protein